MMNYLAGCIWVYFVLLMPVAVSSEIIQDDIHSALSVAMDTTGTGITSWVLVLKDPRSERRKGWSGGVGYRSNRPYDKDPALLKLTQDIVKDYALSLVEQWPIKSLNVHCLVINIDNTRQANLIEKLSVDQRVKWVQPYQEFELLDNFSSKVKNQTSSVEQLQQVDPYRKLQTAFQLLNLDMVAQQYRGEGITIAMIDSGIELNHPDLKDANIEHIDIVGAESGQDSRSHLEHHGTGVAGIMVAQPNNAEGISGVAPEAKLIAYRSCWEGKDRKARCNTLTLSRALDQIAQLKPEILNLSLTGPRDRLLDELTQLIASSGTLIVAAFDRNRSFDERFPSLSSHVFFAISGVGEDTQSSHKFLEHVVYSPGVDVLTAQPGESYAFMSGDSFSSAHLSAVLSLIKQAAPEVTLKSLKRELKNHTFQDGNNTKLDVCAVLYRLKATTKCQIRLAQANSPQEESEIQHE